MVFATPISRLDGSKKSLSPVKYTYSVTFDGKNNRKMELIKAISSAQMTSMGTMIMQATVLGRYK